jgi:V-type H+-transporting ATPase proteolipid subunit
MILFPAITAFIILDMPSIKQAAIVGASILAGMAAADTLPLCADKYPQSAAFFGAMGCAAAAVFSNLGSAYGIAKSGIGLSHLGIVNADRIMRGIVPVVMAGILGIYGLIVAVIINNNIKTDTNSYASFSGYMHFAAGLAAGLSSLAAGLAIGIVGDTAVRAYGKQERIFVAMILMLIFSEAMGLFGLIIALLMNNTANKIPAGCA